MYGMLPCKWLKESWIQHRISLFHLLNMLLNVRKFPFKWLNKSLNPKFLHPGDPSHWSLQFLLTSVKYFVRFFFPLFVWTKTGSFWIINAWINAWDCFWKSGSITDIHVDIEMLRQVVSASVPAKHSQDFVQNIELIFRHLSGMYKMVSPNL